MTFTREFNKVDNYFSYVGGLIGTIIGFIFIMGKYTEKAYEVSIAHKLFRSDDGSEVKSSSFNFFYFMLMSVKPLLNFCGCEGKKLENTQKYIDVSEECNSQLDITYILRKLMFLDSVIAHLMEKQ